MSAVTSAVGEPAVSITGGAPTPAEEQAVRAAILGLWRQDIAAAAKRSGMNPWVLAARAEGTGRGAHALRGSAAGAWRVSGRFGSAESNLQPGRGDAR